MGLIAKIITKNKFWIVEENGSKVATIQTLPGGVAFVKDNHREQFASIKLLELKYNIAFSKTNVSSSAPTLKEVYGYPCDKIPFNIMINITTKLPVFTKSKKSKSYFCAGHYLIEFNVGYVYAYCPKLITLERYTYKGPFLTKTQAKTFAKSQSVPFQENTIS